LSCYESDDNRKRKQRANEIALKNNLSAHNVAAAWTINQSFSSFALVGPRKVEEIDSTLPCLDFHLDQEQIDWLNLVS
jgi:aryl-alcohol dehydrogenase-like predicted oxidoreductase